MFALLISELFWILIVGFGLLCWSSYEESLIGGMLSLGATILGLWWLADINIFTWILANPGLLLFYGVGYFVIGTLWSLFKWYLLALKQHKKLYEFGTYGKMKREDYSDQEWATRVERLKPVAKENKAKITGWITYWPTSVLMTLLRGIIEDFSAWTAETFNGYYNKIVGHVFKED